MTIQRLLFSWLVWLLLIAVPLNTGATLLLGDAPLPQPSSQGEEGIQSHKDAQRDFFKETSSASQEFSLQSERQSKKTRVLIRRLDTTLQDQDRTRRLRSAPIIISRPTHFFFPRKLSPPTASDDPFMS
jgi:hypothetical protein